MTKQQQFWNWFTQHEAEFYDFDPDRETERERLFDQVAAQLPKVDRDLTFEFGPRNTRREFVISAGGIKRAFPAVVSLTEAAPNLDRWKVIAFRPRRPPVCTVEINGRLVDPKDVQFTLLNDGRNAGIRLFIPGFRDEDADLQQIGYIMLDQALGEFDVETRLGLIQMLPPETHTDGVRYPLKNLPVLFDKLLSQLEKRSGLPS